MKGTKGLQNKNAKDLNHPTMLETSPSPSGDLSVLEVLQRPNPQLIPDCSWNSDLPSNSDHDMLDHVTVFKHWSDFNFPAIALAFGDILDQDIKALRSDYERVRSLSGTPTMIGRKGELDDLAFSWTYQVLRHPVKGAAAILRPRTSARGRDTTPEEVRWGSLWWHHGLCPRLKLKSKGAISDDSEPLETQYRHNHPSERKKSLAYLVGTSRLKELWKSEWLKRDPCDLRVVAEPPPEWPVPFSLTKPHLDVQDTRLLPLREVATYCRFAQTRYGYILTQSEFVALRVRRIPPPSNETKPHAAVEYVSVPWEAETGLTTTLAMWALACMAMNDEQREMEMVDGKPLRAMARLTWWTYDETEKVYENVISKRRIPAVEWRQAEYGAFVQLMEEEGNSHTKNFVPPKEPRGPSMLSKANVIRDLPFRPVKMVSKVSGKSQPQGESLAPTDSPVPLSTTSMESGRTREARIDRKPYTLAYSTQQKRWQVAVDGNMLFVERDAKTRRHYVIVNGTARDVEML